MAELVDAYDTRTGRPVPHRVPSDWIGHPVLGAHLSLTPPAPQSIEVREPAETPKPRAARSSAEPPRGGDKED